jgi:hypothetical protein
MADVKTKVCPHCGSDGGYFIRTYVTGKTVYRYNSDGTIGDNTHLHDYLHYRDLKTKYCEDCEKALPKSVFK